MSKRCKWGHDTPQPTCPDCMQPDTSVHYATGTGKSLAQQNQELRALLKEAECPHAEDDYKSVRRNGGWYCYAGKKIKKTGHYALEDGNCPFCARRDALLGEGNDG